jgi:MFS family permease
MTDTVAGDDTGARRRLAAVVWVVMLAQVVLYPNVPELVDVLGASERLDGGTWFLAAEFGAFVVFAGVWGYASDRLGRRVPLIVAGAVGGAVGYALLALAPRFALGFDAVLLLRAAQGAATIGAFSLAMTMLTDLDGGHGKNMGAAGIAIGLGTAIGAPLGGAVATVDPLAPLALASFLLVCGGAIALTAPDRAPASESGSTGSDLRAAMSRLSRRPALGVPYAFGFIDRLTAGFFALVGTFYFQTRFGLGPAATGMLLACFFVPFALLQYPMGLLSDRVGRFLPVVAGSICYGLTIVCVVLAPTVALAALAMVLVGVCGALVSPATMALVTDIAPEDDRGSAMGGFNIFGSLGFLAGFLLGGWLTDAYGFTTAFFVTGLLEVGIALVASRAVARLGQRVVPVPGVGPSD